MSGKEIFTTGLQGDKGAKESGVGVWVQGYNLLLQDLHGILDNRNIKMDTKTVCK
jgi:hypothetical protein